MKHYKALAQLTTLALGLLAVACGGGSDGANNVPSDCVGADTSAFAGIYFIEATGTTKTCPGFDLPSGIIEVGPQGTLLNLDDSALTSVGGDVTVNRVCPDGTLTLAVSNGLYTATLNARITGKNLEGTLENSVLSSCIVNVAGSFVGGGKICSGADTTALAGTYVLVVEFNPCLGDVIFSGLDLVVGPNGTVTNAEDSFGPNCVVTTNSVCPDGAVQLKASCENVQGTETFAWTLELSGLITEGSFNGIYRDSDYPSCPVLVTGTLPSLCDPDTSALAGTYPLVGVPRSETCPQTFQADLQIGAKGSVTNAEALFTQNSLDLCIITENTVCGDGEVTVTASCVSFDTQTGYQKSLLGILRVDGFSGTYSERDCSFDITPQR